MATLKAIFDIPEDHRLVQVRRKRTGEGGAYGDWEYKEYDAAGVEVAHYKRWNHTEPGYPPESGWAKLSPSGKVLAHSNDTPAEA